MEEEDPWNGGWAKDGAAEEPARVAGTSAAHINANTTMRGTQDAWTAGVAPELISSRQATRHTDIFA